MGTIKATNIEPIADNGTVTLGSSGDQFTLATGAKSSFLYPSFFAKTSTDTSISIPSNTATKAEFADVLYDEGNCYDETTHRFTPGVAGKYLITCNVGIGGLDDNEYQATQVFKNGSGFSNFYNGGRVRVIAFSPGATRSVTNTITFIDQANTTDYYEVYVYQSDSVSNYQRNQYGSWFGAYRIGS